MRGRGLTVIGGALLLVAPAMAQVQIENAFPNLRFSLPVDITAFSI